MLSNPSVPCQHNICVESGVMTSSTPSWGEEGQKTAAIQSTSLPLKVTCEQGQKTAWKEVGGAVRNTVIPEDIISILWHMSNLFTSPVQSEKDWQGQRVSCKLFVERTQHNKLLDACLFFASRKDLIMDTKPALNSWGKASGRGQLQLPQS